MNPAKGEGPPLKYLSQEAIVFFTNDSLVGSFCLHQGVCVHHQLFDDCWFCVRRFAAWGNLANVLKANGEDIEAEQAYRKALSFRGNMADAHYNL